MDLWVRLRKWHLHPNPTPMGCQYNEMINSAAAHKGRKNATPLLQAYLQMLSVGEKLVIKIDVSYLCPFSTLMVLPISLLSNKINTVCSAVLWFRTFQSIQKLQVSFRWLPESSISFNLYRYNSYCSVVKLKKPTFQNQIWNTDSTFSCSSKWKIGITNSKKWAYYTYILNGYG